jgi:hypothetical protein
MKDKPRYVICIRNEGADDLEVRKVYKVLPDPDAAKHRLVRVVDESGEDYLYPEDLFAPVELPPATKRAFAATEGASIRDALTHASRRRTSPAPDGRR